MHAATTALIAPTANPLLERALRRRQDRTSKRREHRPSRPYVYVDDPSEAC